MLQVFHCVHFECPSCDKEDVSNWAATSSKASLEPVKEISQAADQVQLTETATEAEEMPIGTVECTD